MTKKGSTIPSIELNTAVERAIDIALNQTHNKNYPIPYLMSKPGAGKSQVLAYKTGLRKLGYKTVHFAFIALEELGGLPRFNEIKLGDMTVEGTRWTIPELISHLYELASQHDFVITLLDDFHLCGPAHQTLGYEFFTERKLRGYKLPDNVGVILAGNDTSKAAAKTLSSGIVNRCYIMKVHTDFDRWRKDFAIPQAIFPPGVQFLSYSAHRHLFHGEEKVNESWPSPRSWTHAFSTLDLLESNYQLTDADVLNVIAGNCGTEAATTFASWYTLYRNVDTRAIFDKQKWNIPSELDRLFIFQSAVALEFFERYNNPKKKEDKEKAIDTIARIIVDLTKEAGEMAISCAKTIVDYASAHKMTRVYSSIATRIQQIDPKAQEVISKAIMNIV